MSLPSALVARLERLLDPADLLMDDESRVFYAQDVFTRSLPAGAVIRPRDARQLSRAVAAITAAGLAVIGRGGGMSYTSGFVPVEPDSVIVDTSAMNRVLEVNREDMYVTAEAGCTWAGLAEALRGTGLRTPFRGPLSGLRATVGGSVSQNSVYWGAGLFGASADSVVSIEVVLADGRVLNTGAASQAFGTPFFRHFGPDLTGLFTCDSGALGIKSAVTLRLVAERPAVRHLSFDFAGYRQQMAAMSDIARAGLAAQMFGTDPNLARVRARRESVLQDVKALGRLVRSKRSLLEAVTEGARAAAAGRRAIGDVRYPVHANVEEPSDAAADWCIREAEGICRGHGGEKIASTVPQMLHASPFNPLTNMVGPDGERWVPIHALAPHSKAVACVEAAAGLFRQHADELAAGGVVTGFLTTTVSSNCFFIEPLFFWPDSLNELHRATVGEAALARQRGFPANPAVRSLVAELRSELACRYADLGVSHLQLGKEYHYFDKLGRAAANTVAGIKRILDPGCRMNPGALGLWPAAEQGATNEHA